MLQSVPSIDMSFKGVHDGGLYRGEEICAIFAEGEEVLAVLLEDEREDFRSDGEEVSTCSIATVSSENNNNNKPHHHQNNVDREGEEEDDADAVEVGAVVGAVGSEADSSSQGSIENVTPSPQGSLETVGTPIAISRKPSSTIIVTTTTTTEVQPLQPLQDEANNLSTPTRKLLLKAKLTRRFSNKVNQAAYRMRSAVRGHHHHHPHSPNKRILDVDDDSTDDGEGSTSTSFYPTHDSHSSITGSTGDFSDMSSLVSFRSWGSNDKTDPWAAAKRGDYFTLQTLARELEVDWSQEDLSGNVPLYYACRYGGSSGKTGLRSVQLLAELWKGPIPENLVKRCKKDAANHAVKRILVGQARLKKLGEANKNGGAGGDHKNNDADEVVLDGLSLVNPVIGDDGFVEDY